VAHEPTPSERSEQPDAVVAYLAYLLGEVQHALNWVAYGRGARRWQLAGLPALYFNYVYALVWALLIILLIVLAAATPYALPLAIIASFRYAEIAVWYVKLLFDSTHYLILSAERNLLFLVIDGMMSVAVVALWLTAASSGVGASPEWSAALSTVTLNGAPPGYEDWQATVATVLGTVAGLVLIGAGLALLVGLISERFDYGPAEKYTGPTRLTRPTGKTDSPDEPPR
jgi:hypothetical protein